MAARSRRVALGAGFLAPLLPLALTDYFFILPPHRLDRGGHAISERRLSP